MIRSRLSRSAFWEMACSSASAMVLLTPTVLAGVVFTTFALGTSRMGLLPCSAMICLILSQLDLTMVKLHGVAPVS